MATVQEFFRNPLVTWVTSFRTTSTAETINDFADGVFLNEVMIEIDPTYFALTRVHQNVDGDVNVRIQNLDVLVRHLKAFYQEKLQQLVLMRAPDVVAIAHCPDSDVGLQELVKLLLLMLGCAVQCDNKESFIEKIKDMDLEVQKHLVEYIKQITENANHVLTFRMNELQDSTIEHVLVVAESMFYQMSHLIEERDQSFADNTHLKLEKEMLLQERQRAKSPRPFSPPPSSGHLAVDSPSMAASKEKLRMMTEEMEEKASLMAELKDELLASKRMIEKLRQENKDLSQDAVLVKAFRDQIDVLKVKADRVEKLEADAVKFKEKLRDLEYLKKRAEELKEENVILLDNRQLLREQLSSLSNKEEKIEILEEENKKLKSHIHHIAEERQFEQEKLNEVMATNAQLNIEKQESMAELASLNAEIDALRGKSPSGSVNLASECHESSSMDVLRLSHQNEHLKKSLEDLRSSTTKLIELERENRALHQKNLEEKSTIHRLNEELSKAKALNKQKHLLSTEVMNLSGELKQKDEEITHLENENYSKSSELQEKLEDAEEKDLSMKSLKERVLKNEKQLLDLDNKNKHKDVVIIENKKTIEGLSESLNDKDRQLKSLHLRLNESVEDQSKADTVIRKQKKEIAELENKVEEEAIKKKKYEELLNGKENEIMEYARRFEEIQSSKTLSDDNVKRKDKELHDLKNKLQAASDECEQYKDGLNAKDKKILSLQKRVEDLTKLVDENSEVFGQNIREKDKQNRHFERRIEELTESVSEVEKMKLTMKQKDDKINSLIKSFNEKEDEVREIESRLEDATSEINKLGHTIKLKEKKIEALESSLTEIETSSFVVKDDRITEIKRTVEVRDNRIVELENKVEDLTTLNNKLQHSIKLKESRITDLESRVEEFENVTFEKNRLTQNLEQKMKQIMDLETSLEDFKDENLRLQHNWTQKSNKVKELESKLVDLESYIELSQSLKQTLNNKDDRISTLNRNLNEKEEELAELENGLKEDQAQNRKLKHTIKIKDEKILALENRVEELEALVNESKKLAQINQSKETKIETLENKLEELDGIANTNEKLQKSLSQKEEKINRLQERLDDVEDAVTMNNKLNQHLKHRDNKIKALGKRILELEDTLEVKEKEQMVNAQANYTKIRELETRLEEYVQEREAKVVALQSRLDGSVDRYRQMDMTIGEKEMKIAELEAKLSEANDACRENNKLTQMLKAKDARLTEFDNKVHLLESSFAKCEKREQERNDKLEILQKRLEETLNLNNKLDKSVRKKEENIRILEKTLQANEKREEELEVLLETRTEKLTESKNRVLELNDIIESKENEIDELGKRLNEFCNATTSDQKTASLLQEKDTQLVQMTERLEGLEADKTNILRILREKEKEIEDSEQRVTASTTRKNETRITILTQSNKKLEENIFNLESHLEESNSQLNNLSRKLDQKDERIKGLKNRLEEAVHQNNKLTHALDLKEDKIRAVESRLGDASKQMLQLREENQSRTPGRDKDSKPGKASSTIIFKPAYNSRDDRKTVQMLSVADKRIADLNDEIRVLEKQNATVKTQSEALSSRNAQLQIENESLFNELRLVKGDYSSLQSELNEARDYYHQLDLSAVNMGHRCEMLSQLNATLEEENKALHDKVSWLMGQNRELMVKSLEEKDQFMEEERFFSDRLYSLQRTKEKLEEQIDLANKALSEVALPKKKPGFFKKMFKKSGPSKKKEDIKTANKSQVQLLRADFRDNVEGSTSRNAEQYEESYIRSSSEGLDESCSRDSSIAGDSGRGSKGHGLMQSGVSDGRQRNYPAFSTSSMLSPQEEMHSRKISHDVSAFRARQVRSEIFSDNFQAGQLSRPKSLDNLNRIGGFRGSNDTLSSASAVTVDNVPSKNFRRYRKKTPPPSPPSSAFRVVQAPNGSPYTPRADAIRRSPPIEKDYQRKMTDSSQNANNAPSPSSSVSRSRRSSFSSAVSAHESDHEMDRKEESVSSKRSSIAERLPPPSYRSGLNSSFRLNRSDEFSPQGRRSSRGPPPPYQRPSMDDVKQDEITNLSSERRPPPYPEASRLKRTPSIKSKTGTPREEPVSCKNDYRDSPLDSSPREEQRTWENQSTPQFHKTNPLSVDAGSPILDNRYDSSMDDEPEILIDATQSTVSAVPVPSPSSKEDSNKIISTFFQPVESLQESPLRRMNSMPRYNLRSRSMDEPQGRTYKQSGKTSDTLFAAVLVRQRSLSDDTRRTDDKRRPDDTRRPQDLPLSSEPSRTNKPPAQPVPNSPVLENKGMNAQSPKASGSLENAQQIQPPDESTTDATDRSVSSRDDSGSEGRSKSRSGSRTPLRGKNTHQWLEYGCV